VAGDFNASREAYQQVIGLDADNMEAQFGLGQLCLVIPDREAAKSAFRKVLEREPDWTEAQFELGRLSSGPEAVALLEKAAASKPDWIEARVALGVAKLGNGDAAGAEALFRDVLKKQPKNASAHSRLGMVLAAKQDFAGAESELTQGLAGAPNDADAVMALGRVYAATDRAEEAFTQFRSAASLDRQSPDALIEAGVYALKISRNALAQAFLEKAVERAPKSAMAQARYADSLLARGEKAGAKEHYKLALAGEGAIDRQDVQRRLDALK
jgi:Flp pilus assembly protein TadD